MNEPLAVAIDTDDHIYIADTFNHRINVYSSNGEFERSWGKLGRESGQLRFPQALAISPKGEVIVADTGNNRVVVFDRAGTYLRSWGMLGAGDRQFNQPVGVAVWNDRVAVADRANERVCVSTLQGEPVWSVGGFGREEGSFDYPSDVAFDDAGNVYVADSYNNRIQKFDQNGRVVRVWGGWGSFSGLLANPSGIAIRDRRVFVTDLINHRIQVFDLDGKYMYQWGRHPVTGHEGNGRLHYPSRLAVSPAGSFTVVCEPFEYRCQVFSQASFNIVRNVDDRAWWDKAGRFHYGTRVKSKGRMLTIAEPDTHSVLVFDIAADPRFVARLGSQGRNVGDFVRPSGMAIDLEKSEILVSDGGNHRLQRFALDGKLSDATANAREPMRSKVVAARSVIALGLPSATTRNFPGVPALRQGEKQSSPVEPGALQVGPDGNYYLADPHNARILVLNNKLELVRSFGKRGSGPGEMLIPNDLSFSKDGKTLYVVDTYNFRIVAFSPGGEYKFDWGSAGPMPDQFIHPFGITSGMDGFVYVSDDAANRVQKFDEKGKLVKSWGRWGTEPGQFYKPKGLTQDERGHIIICDFGNHRAQIMDADGNFISMFGIGEGYTPPAAMVATQKATSGPLPSNGGTYVIAWKVADGVAVPLNKPFDMDVAVLRAGTDKPAEGVKITIGAVMPAHYHGMNTAPEITKTGPAQWRVRGMLLHMPGAWQVTFDIDNGIVVERAQSDVTVR
jgi:Uncharacterized conserved protein